MAVELWAVGPRASERSGARRSHSAGGSFGSYEPALAGLEASKLNSKHVAKLNFMLNSKSGLGGSCVELASSLCSRCSGAIGLAHTSARRATI